MQTMPDAPGGIARFANPGRFMRLSGAVLPWVGLGALVTTVLGLGWGGFVAPRDWQQGETVRIMYLHVPSAWMAMGLYLGLGIASLLALVWKHALADLAAQAIAPVGACFTVVCLATGSLWGRPMWGAYWVWDARLTSVLILLFLYLGHIALSGAFDDPRRGEKSAAILALVGLVNVPIIKFSVDWWNTLHQPASVTRLAAPGIHAEMLWPLLISAVGFTLLGGFLVLLRLRTEVLRKRARGLMLARANRAAVAEATA
jgi:heme exporter protein C